MQRADSVSEILPVARPWALGIADDADERRLDERFISVSYGFTEAHHRPFENVIDVRFSIFTEVELEGHALFAAARSVASRPRSRR